MSDFRRYKVAGGTYFFTVVTADRRPLFNDLQAVRLFGEVLRECQAEWPFTIEAIVLLPDHLHALWSLPPSDLRYSARWSRIKLQFTKRWLLTGGSDSAVSPSQRNENRRGVWQPRFWEHTIQDESDFDGHFDYIHFNPVKHGYVRCPVEWPHSSFHRWVQAGVYPRNWACGQPPPDLSRLDNRCGEPLEKP